MAMLGESQKLSKPSTSASEAKGPATRGHAKLIQGLNADLGQMQAPAKRAKGCEY